jgi:hypothetical protein
MERMVESHAYPAVAAELANIACDCEINDDEVESGAVFPTDPRPCLPERYGWERHKMAEEYWAHIEREVEIVEVDPEDVPDQSKQEPVEGLPERILVVRRRRRDAQTDAEELQHDRRPHGSGSSGRLQPHEQPGPGDKGYDPKRHPAVIGKAEREQIADEVAREAIEQAENVPGSVSANVIRWAKRRLRPPQVPWERELAALIHQAFGQARGCVDYSYEMPARRGSFGSIIMPGMVRPMPQAAIVVDTSLSMDSEDLLAALSETEGIIAACGQRSVSVYCCDVQAAPVQRVGSALEVQLIGGGGTDMGAGIEAAAKDGHRVIVVLTDMGTPWPERMPPGTQLVIGAIGTAAAVERWRNTGPVYAKRVVAIRTGPLDDEEAA